MVVMLFFFSSRRRHTRYWRDWSSDVCSSDLAMVGCAEPTVVTWRRRYAESGLAGLEDLPRPGKPSPLPDALRDRVLELTLTEPPTPLGATHWSSRLLASALAGAGTSISHVTIARIWHRFGVQPWRAQTFKFSTDPELEGKIRDVVGLYLHPPEKIGRAHV